MSCLKYPVVLLHGLGGLQVFGASVLTGIARGLQRQGIAATALTAEPYHSIEQRAKTWARGLQAVLTKEKSEGLHIIAHSMAGLDARFLIQQQQSFRYVRSLTTIATPHQGTAVADFLLAQPWLLHGATFGMHIVGRLFYGGNPDPCSALRDLSRTHLAQWNAQVPNHPDVAYFSVTAKAGFRFRHPVSPFLSWTAAILFAEEGDNDGLVSSRSAVWGEHLLEVVADHFQLSGLMAFSPSRFNTQALHGRVCQRLLAWETAQGV
jgi:triacylglycerol lipase